MVTTAVVRAKRVRPRRERAHIYPDPCDHERELPYLEQPQAHSERKDIPITKPPSDSRKEKPLEQKHCEHDSRNRRRFVQQEHRIYQHPDRDEEEHREDVPQRSDVRQGLVTIVRLAQDHPGDECSKSEREAKEISSIPDPEPGGDYRD